MSKDTDKAEIVSTYTIYELPNEPYRYEVSEDGDGLGLVEIKYIETARSDNKYNVRMTMNTVVAKKLVTALQRMIKDIEEKDVSGQD